MWKRGFPLLVLLAVVACATAGPPPRGVNVVLTSGLEFEPIPPEQLAFPRIQALIKQCEEVGGGHCNEHWKPIDNRVQLSRNKHEAVYTVIDLYGLQGNRTYTIEHRLYNPNDELQGRHSVVLHLPPSWELSDTQNTYFVWSPADPATWPLGRWRIEIFVNGQLETERSFEVVGNGSAKIQVPASTVLPESAAYSGKWVGKWDNTWPVKFTVWRVSENGEGSLRYRWKEYVDGSWSQEDGPYKIQEGKLVSGWITIEIDAENSNTATAIGRFPKQT